ncbi:MAG: porin family protein [Bacteroidota bacterium]
MTRLALILLLLPALASAQYLERYGARVGGAGSTYVGDPDTEFDGVGGLVVGFTFDFYVSETLTVRPELSYLNKGARVQTPVDFGDGGTPVDINARFDVTYIEVPVLVRYRPRPFARWTPAFHAGPTVAFNTGATVTFSAVGAEDTEFQQSDDSIKGVDYGFAAGAGIDVDLDGRLLSLEARYTRGITNIVSDDDDPKFNGTWSLTLGIGL